MAFAPVFRLEAVLAETGYVNTQNNAVPAVPSPNIQGPQLVQKQPEKDFAESLHWLPCTLAVDLPVLNFKVADLLQLHEGTIVETGYHQSSDLPLRVNNQLVGWTEFEVVGDRLAVRLTDLS